MMGTRAVTHFKLGHTGKDIWVATHWDGYPEQLGKDLKELAGKVRKAKDEKADDILQEQGVAVLAKRHIDYMSVDGEDEFNKRYGDWAEWFYELDDKGKLTKKSLSGEWKGSPLNKYKQMGEELQRKKGKLAKVLGGRPDVVYTVKR
jgi:hypothetical protein